MTTESIPMSTRLRALTSAVQDDTPDDTACDAAQRQLARHLDGRRPRRRTPRLVLAGTCGALLVAAALLVLPLLSGHQGDAFAAVQQHLANFETLHMTITQRVNGITQPTIRVWTDRAGNVRSDIGDSTSVVVNADDRQVLVLLHGPRQAMRMPLPMADHSGIEDQLDWLDAVRRFRGRAEHLAQTRVIDGVVTDGWLLDTAGMQITLWADRDGLPHAVDIGGKVNLHQHLQLELDKPIDADRFSTALPEGYSLMQGD